MLKTDIELINDPKYEELKTAKIKEKCQRYHLAVLTDYTNEIAWFKRNNPDPDPIRHPGCIFKVETAIKLFYDAYKDELDAIPGCKEEVENFYKNFPE